MEIESGRSPDQVEFICSGSGRKEVADGRWTQYGLPMRSIDVLYEIGGLSGGDNFT